MFDIGGKIRRATDSEVTQVRDRLSAVGMVYEDIDPVRSLFWVAERNDSMAGIVRLELDSPGALLGSLYVEPEHRGNGLGEALIEYIEQEARSRGATHIYLFSTGAGDYFRMLGYKEIPVEKTVSDIPNTPQVEYYRDRPDLLADEVTFQKSLTNEG